MNQLKFFLFLFSLFLFTSCDKGSRHYDQADKGYTTEELEADYETLPPQSITIVATDFNLKPAEITAQAGQLIKLTFENEGSTAHNLAFELTAGVVKFEEDVPAGETKEMEFTVPIVLGEYPYYCPVGNHRQQGMEGTLTIVKPENAE